MPDPAGEDVRLAELVAALSLATDLGLGQPMEHVLRSCRIALGVGAQIGLTERERAAAYYVTLLAWVGCTADSAELAARFGDDIALRADAYGIDLDGLPMLTFLLRRAGAGSAPLRRARLAAAFVVTGGRSVVDSMLSHCQVASTFAEEVGLGPEVHGPLRQVFARWDGRGVPEVGGEELAMPVRLAQLADIVEVHHRLHGVEGAVAVAEARSGGQFDPRLVAAFTRCAPRLLAELDDGATWEAVIGSAPALDAALGPDEIDRALTAMADFVDLKTPYRSGHSRAVSALAAEAGRRRGLAADEVRDLHRAGLLHDLGRLGVPNTIWDKPGPLTGAEVERVRLHPYYAARMLRRPPLLARVGALATTHAERLDGSGYPRALPGAALGPGARVLAAADVYQAMVEPRPYRAALPPPEAAASLRGGVRAGRLDSDAVEAVLAAAGHRTGARRVARPGGLTAREVQVLAELARGASNREIARRLVIAEKTVRNHVERIYAKIDVSTRAAATLYAMRHGLLDDHRGE
jgi:HD-GYP domain-containing protein (c-di-GMP phosphodiesterase class II)